MNSLNTDHSSLLNCFDPSKIQTVRAAQKKIRELDMTLFSSVKNTLGADKTFVYSTLVGCAALLDRCSKGEFSAEVLKFAKDVVGPTVKHCFAEIDNFQGKLNENKLKLSLMKKLDSILFYPKKTDFKEIKDESTIQKIQEILDKGILTLYKIKDADDKFYGGRIDLCEDSFSKIAEILEQAGYKEKQDLVGSSFDAKGHITTIGPSELSSNYESIVADHNTFINEKSEDSQLEAVCLKKGSPQSGRLNRVFIVTMKVHNLDYYRKACGLGAMRFSPHLSVFSQEITPLKSIKDISINKLTENKNEKNLFTLNNYVSKHLENV